MSGAYPSWVTATITVDELLGATAAQFRNRNGRNRTSGTVHAVVIQLEWLGAAPLPVPACGSGVGGTSGRLLEPTVSGVTCHRCQDSAAGRSAAQRVPTPHQYSLLDDQFTPA